MKKVAALFLIPLFLLSGCISWQEGANTTLNVIAKATDITKNAGMSVFEAECIEIAKKCFETDDKECPALTECQKARQEFARYVFAVYRSLLAANVALSFEKEKPTKEYIKKTQELLLQLYKAVELIAPGLLPKSSELTEGGK